jgi:hypothetical protein
MEYSRKAANKVGNCSEIHRDKKSPNLKARTFSYPIPDKPEKTNSKPQNPNKF